MSMEAVSGVLETPDRVAVSYYCVEEKKVWMGEGLCKYT